MNFASEVGESLWKNRQRERTELVLPAANALVSRKHFPFPKPNVSPTPQKPAYALVSLRVDCDKLKRGHGNGGMESPSQLSCPPSFARRACGVCRTGETDTWKSWRADFGMGL